MKRHSTLAFAAALAGLAAIPSVTVVDAARMPTASEAASSAQQQPTKQGQNAPGEAAKAARLGTGYRRRTNAPRGKRYSASVRQHQRATTKARNVRRARAAKR